ncbi:MAG: hypothetical protein FWC66_09845, partial [Oscillospiraceae bacterium]|nr:hypothetical protein [Oscillospiraceae bacterium]
NQHKGKRFSHLSHKKFPPLKFLPKGTLLVFSLCKLSPPSEDNLALSIENALKKYAYSISQNHTL